jgi:predicted restriction endonuclease
MTSCHSERSEESLEKKEILHFVQDDKTYYTAKGVRQEPHPPDSIQKYQNLINNALLLCKINHDELN